MQTFYIIKYSDQHLISKFVISCHFLQTLQRDIKSLQNEITAMAKNSQDLLTSTTRESQELVTCSLANLNERVQLLENQAQRQGEKLRQADRKWKEYRGIFMYYCL